MKRLWWWFLIMVYRLIYHLPYSRVGWQIMGWIIEHTPTVEGETK